MIERSIGIRISPPEICAACLVPLLFLFIGIIPAFSQSPQPSFRHYAVEDGLPSSEVYHAMQDSKGYIWFATDMGISRFNGYEFENFTLKDGLPDLTIFNIYEDYKGRIWFISFSGSLSYYNADKIYQYAFNEALQKQVKNLYKSSFYVDREENVYVSAHRHGYFKISKSGEITQFKEDAQSTYHIKQMDTSVVFNAYTAGESTALRFKIERERETFLIDSDVQISNANHTCIRRDDSTLLFAAGNELIEIQDDLGLMMTRISHKAISLTEDRNKKIWVGTFQGGVFFYEDQLTTEPSRST